MDIISIGECMVELFSSEPLASATSFRKSYGGDALNLLVAASRLGSSTSFVSRLGDDPFAAYLLESWQAEGIDTSQVKLAPGFNGLYFVSLLAGGEREFTYYRKGSAASTMDPGDLDPAALRQCKLLHVSGITQAISPTCRAAVLEAVRLAKEGGALVSYDPNFRPKLWSIEEARQGLEEVLPYTDIILPNAPTETEQLVAKPSPHAAIHYFRERGVKVIAIKLGPWGCALGAQGHIAIIPAIAPRGVLDTTGAGDAFNGGFLHGLVRGLDPWEAARIGVVVSGLKVAGRGAVASLPSKREVEEVLQRESLAAVSFPDTFHFHQDDG